MPVTSPVLSVAAVPREGTVAPEPPERHASMSFAETAQATLGLAGKGAELANPATLAALAVKSLEGYFERARKAQEHLKDLGRRRDRAAAAEGASPGNGEPGAHPGPAWQPFISSEDDLGLIQKPHKMEEKTQELGWENFVKEMEKIVESQRFRTETLMIASGVGAVSKAINTLVRGQ